MNQDNHTIFALATPPGRAGVAVIRVSGPAVKTVCALLAPGPRPPARQASVKRIIDPASGETIDRALILLFESPASFTGEDVLELHLHGGRAIIDRVTAALSGIGDCRPAEAGEFTRRAFDNGKLDLTEVEGLADLIDAQTEAQRRQAVRQYEGELGALVTEWRDALVRVLAYAEADLDFPDEDLPDDVGARVDAMTEPLREAIRHHLAGAQRAERLREGYRIVIVGEPNVGKSSLFNRLVQRSAAIVSDRPGTTRDVIEVTLDIGGYAVTLCDTAGLRDGADEIETEGIRRAEAEAERADLVLWVLEPESGFERAREWVAPVIIVRNKADLGDVGSGDIAVSALTGEGISTLLTAISRTIGEKLAPPESVGITRARHRRALSEVGEALDRASTAPAPELMAEDLRLALRALGRLTGRVDVEDLLDVIFRDFCIGK